MELDTVVSCYPFPRNRNWVLWTNNQCSQPQSHLSNSYFNSCPWYLLSSLNTLWFFFFFQRTNPVLLPSFLWSKHFQTSDFNTQVFFFNQEIYYEQNSYLWKMIKKDMYLTFMFLSEKMQANWNGSKINMSSATFAQFISVIGKEHILRNSDQRLGVWLKGGDLASVSRFQG